MAKDCEEHCWHQTGAMLTSNPPKIEFICCHCGAKESHTISIYEDTKSHGEYAPSSFGDYDLAT